jgi:hypothetical protein
LKRVIFNEYRSILKNGLIDLSFAKESIFGVGIEKYNSLFESNMDKKADSWKNKSASGDSGQTAMIRIYEAML